MEKRGVRLSAQAIVIDENGRLVLEKNRKIGKYSFIGGAFEPGVGDKTLLDTVMREVHEETGLLIDGERFCAPELQLPTQFGTGIWESTYFLLLINKHEVSTILANKNFIAFKNRPYTHLPIEKERFREQVTRARNYFKAYLGN